MTVMYRSSRIEESWHFSSAFLSPFTACLLYYCDNDLIPSVMKKIFCVIIRCLCHTGTHWNIDKN